MTANKRQVGGDHYKSRYQHWDWVADVKLPYHPACAAKYLVRHRHKNGDEDLQKAIHYLEKTMELSIVYNPQLGYYGQFWNLVLSSELTLMEANVLFYIASGQWDMALKGVKHLLGDAS